jgi:hypothetical protein
VTNNVVVTSSCWGIGYASVHGGKIINNTALDDGTDAGTKNPAGKVVCGPKLMVGDKTHQGSSSNDVVIRNNIANTLVIDNRNPNMMMDHNICLTINGRCQILTFVNGKPNLGVYKPGVYGDHNIIDRRGAADTFVRFDPAKLAYDLRLKPGASAIGAGSPDGAPGGRHHWNAAPKSDRCGRIPISPGKIGASPQRPPRGRPPLAPGSQSDLSYFARLR